MSVNSGCAEGARVSCRSPEGLRYYDVRRHWTKRIEPHLGDEAHYLEESAREERKKQERAEATRQRSDESRTTEVPRGSE